MTRRTLRERNRAAIALAPETAGIEAPAASRRPAQSAPALKAAKGWSQQDTGDTSTATRKRPAPARKAVAVAAGDTARLGIYLTPHEFTDAKAAYLADWTNGGEADTFARWIAAAIDTYAARTPPQRAVTAQPKERAQERTGSTRSFAIPTDTLARMRAAVTADQQVGRWLSDSAWCGEAISHAVQSARTRNAGTLPTPPPRLPNRLVR